MSKQKVPENFMQDFLKSGGRSPDKQHTGDTQTTDEHSTDAVQTTHRLKRYDVRFDPDTWARIQTEARRRGLSTSAMLRMIVNEWLQQ